MHIGENGQGPLKCIYNECDISFVNFFQLNRHIIQKTQQIQDSVNNNTNF